MTARREQIKQEMDPDSNPLIPGGKAAAKAQKELLSSDTTHRGKLNREADPDRNPLIIGSKPTEEAVFDIVNRRDMQAQGMSETEINAEIEHLHGR